MKKTKIITSIGPASNSVEVFKEMVLNGANVARINFSHATMDEREKVISTVLTVREDLNKNIAILYDTKGPEFRNENYLGEDVILKDGENIKVYKESPKDLLGFSVNHKEVLNDLETGNIILLENGLMKIEVEQNCEKYLDCKVISGGVLGNKKSLNVPNVKLNIPFIDEDDYNDIVYACRNHGDFLALSFVSSREDILKVKEILKQEHREDLKIISKIESMTGIDNLDEIIDESYGIMVARGDLGVEVPMTRLPIYQKEIIARCREKGKVAIVATEMLESMKKNLRPTRAEVSDVANAVLDGTDAVMLSGETTTGTNPPHVVKYMADICYEAEKYYDNHFRNKMKPGITEAIVSSALESSKVYDIKVIVASTVSGYSVRRISNLKPDASILATCTSPNVARGLALNYGIETTVVPFVDSTDKIIDIAREEATKVFNLKTSDKILITGGLSTNTNKRITNFMKIEEI